MSTSVTTTPASSLSSTQDSASTTFVTNAVTTDLDTTTEDSVTVETSTAAFSNMTSSSDSPSTQTLIPASHSSLVGSSSTRSGGVSTTLSSTFAPSRSSIQSLKSGSTLQVTTTSALNKSPTTNANKMSSNKSPATNVNKISSNKSPTTNANTISTNTLPTTNANKISTNKSSRTAKSTSTKPPTVSKPPYSAISTTAFTKVTTRAQQNTIGAAVTPVGTANQNQCGNPPSILGGFVSSKGPYYAGVARVVYTCLSGYTLSGTASVLCGINRQWGPTPQCIRPNKEHTGLEEELSGLPLWMAIIIGVAVGLICLLLLICLLGLCLRLFGCWKGSWFGSEPKRSSIIYPELLHPPAPPQVTKTTSMMAVKETGDKQNHSMLTDRYAKRPDIHLSGNGRPPDDHQLTAQSERNVSTKYNRPGFGNGSSKDTRGNFMAPPLVNVNYSVPPVRRQAKRPTGKWMPHSNGLRGYNTSTK